MPTLSEYAKLSNDEVKRGVIEEIITADALMSMLQFKSISGNAHTYNRESTNPAATTHAVGDTWQDTEPTFAQKNAALTIVGLQSPIDLFVQQTRSNINDQQAILLGRMAKGIAEKISDLIIKGEPENVSTEFEGLDSLVRSETRMMAMDDGVVDGPGAAETELTLDRLDAMLDQIEPGKADVIIMNKTMRRKLTSLSRATGSGVLMDNIEMFGHRVMTYDNIPIILNDRITNAEAYNDAGTWPSSTATTIFAVKLGEQNDGYTVLHNGPVLDPQITDVGIKENKNERLFRLAVYIQSATWSSKAVAALGGIDSTA